MLDEIEGGVRAALRLAEGAPLRSTLDTAGAGDWTRECARRPAATRASWHSGWRSGSPPPRCPLP
ncbi:MULTISPECIES: hypothetical protein [unclassified Streptomyces]|uniref:hypothetical protein n=1 Tax=unclassified Streptomyces TaxID=2593676 RepID=UPI0015EC38A2|nr:MULTISPECIES: hypothetical protein [unclassified Streptomyces]